MVNVWTEGRIGLEKAGHFITFQQALDYLSLHFIARMVNRDQFFVIFQTSLLQTARVNTPDSFTQQGAIGKTLILSVLFPVIPARYP